MSPNVFLLKVVKSTISIGSFSKNVKCLQILLVGMKYMEFMLFCLKIMFCNETLKNGDPWVCRRENKVFEKTKTLENLQWFLLENLEHWKTKAMGILAKTGTNRWGLIVTRLFAPGPGLWGNWRLNANQIFCPHFFFFYFRRTLSRG